MISIRRYGTDTGGKVHAANFSITSPNLLFADGYLATAPKLFIDTIGRLPIVHRDFVFVDFGSGKGRALLMAAEFPFKKIIGLEISPILHEIAQQNIDKLFSKTDRYSTIISLNLDVEKFVPPEDPLFCYFYNPFREKVMANVLATLKSSIDQNSRDIWIMYNNALHASLLDTADLAHPIRLYRALSNMAIRFRSETVVHPFGHKGAGLRGIEISTWHKMNDTIQQTNAQPTFVYQRWPEFRRPGLSGSSDHCYGPLYR